MIMLLCLVLACLGQLVSSNTCIICQPGKYNTIFSSRPCQDCQENTFAPRAGMTACLDCVANSTAARGSASCSCLPGMTWTIGSTACIPSCADGLVRSASGGCAMTSTTSLSLKMVMTLGVAPNSTNADVQEGIAIALSDAYKVPRENIVVTVTVLPDISRRRLLQDVDKVRYAVEIRVVFPADASNADVIATKARLSTMNSTELNAALQEGVTGTQLQVFDMKKVQATPSTTSPPALGAPAASSPSTSMSVATGDILVIIVSVCVGLLVVLICAVCCVCGKLRSKTDQ